MIGNPYMQGGYYYPPMQQPMDQLSHLRQQQQQPAQNGIVWVQGEEGAKAYLVAAGNTMILMDSEAQTFYIKSTDSSGMPMPLRAFDYSERTGQAKHAQDTSNYVTREEFERLEKKLTELYQGGMNNAE